MACHFTLKLFAHSPYELDAIYEKLNRLTSLCYPQYVGDPNMNNKLRMKPPLTKFRLGELFGSRNNEMLGFIKSISNSYPDNSPWETKQGKRVPKHIMTSLSFQVIHAKVPRLDHKFYGYANKNRNVKQAEKVLGGIAKGLDIVNNLGPF